jgi:hypothetical protein
MSHAADTQDLPSFAGLRRLATAWRALYIGQVCLVAALLVGVVIERMLPGILAALLRSEGAPAVLLVAGLVLVALNDVAAALVERAQARRLAPTRTRLRRVLGVVYLIPPFMLVRRVLLLVVHALWFGLVALFLLLWFLEIVILALPGRLIPGVAEGFGVASDAVDRVLSAVGTGIRRGLEAISLCPTRRVDHEELVLLRWLFRRAPVPPAPPAPEPTTADPPGPGAVDPPAPPAPEPLQNAETTGTGSVVVASSSRQ